MTRPVATQLTIGASRLSSLTTDARAVLEELARVQRHYDSARLASALGMLSTAVGLLADARGDLHQAALVAQAATRTE